MQTYSDALFVREFFAGPFTSAIRAQLMRMIVQINDHMLIGIAYAIRIRLIFSTL